MQLWSVFAPAPTLNDGESQVAFMTHRRSAWRNRAGIQANRSERAEEARKAHCEVRRTLSRSTSESEKDAQKQKTIDMLVAQMAEPVNPRDARMFKTMQNLEEETARALFDRVLVEGNNLGMYVLSADEKAVL